MKLHEHRTGKQFRREITKEEAVREICRDSLLPDITVLWVTMEIGSWGGKPTTEVAIGYTSPYLDWGLEDAALKIEQRYG